MYDVIDLAPRRGLGRYTGPEEAARGGVRDKVSALRIWCAGCCLAAALVLALLSVPEALAQSNTAESWVKPAEDLIKVLQSGLVTLGAILAGLGVICVGIWAAASGVLDWRRLAYVMLGGFLVMVGPAAIAALLSAAES